MHDPVLPPRPMPRCVCAGILVAMLLGSVLRFWGLAQRGLWEVDEATYTLGARAYVHLFHARATARARGIALHDRTAMRALMAETFPMDYDFRYRFTRGPAREDKLMSGFRTWGKPTFCAAVVLATWLLGPNSTTPALFVSAVAGSILVGVLGWAAWRFTYGEWAAVAAATWAATSLTLVHYSRAGYAAVLWTLCLAAVLVSGLRAWRDFSDAAPMRTTMTRGFLTGALLSVFYGMLPMIVLLVCLEGLWIWRRRRAGAHGATHVAVWVVAFTLPLLVWQVIGVWRSQYLHTTLGFENVYSYVGEVLDQMGTEVEMPPRSLASTVRFWLVNGLALEGIFACLLAVGGAVVLVPRLRQREPGTIAVLGLGVCWLAACTIGQVQLGRLYTPLLPLFGVALGVAVQRTAQQSRAGAAVAVCIVVTYGLWNVRPLLAVRAGLPAAADWIEAHGNPDRVAVTTFGYNQLVRAELDRGVANPPTRALLDRQAELFVDVGPLASRFTERTVGIAPLAVFQEPVLHLPPARLDLAGVPDVWWRFRLDAHAWQQLRGRDPDPSPMDLIRIYAVRSLP